MGKVFAALDFNSYIGIFLNVAGRNPSNLLNGPYRGTDKAEVLGFR